MSSSIGQVAEVLGVSVDTLRYYERIGLADPPRRDAAGRRRYDEADLTWLQFLLRMRTTGMPIQLMQRYADLRRQGPGTSAERRQILQQHRADVVARIAALTDCLTVVDHKIANYSLIEAGLVAGPTPHALQEEVTA